MNNAEHASVSTTPLHQGISSEVKMVVLRCYAHWYIFPHKFCGGLQILEDGVETERF